MLDIVQELRENRFRIEAELKKTDRAPTARFIAEKYGYEFRGVAFVDKTGQYAAILCRETGFDKDAYESAIRQLETDGYEIAKIEFQFADSVEFHDIIFGKKYQGGGTAVIERQDTVTRKPVVITYHKNGKSSLGIFFDTSPEYVGCIQDIAYAIGMEPVSRTEVPDAFKSALEGIRLDDL